MERENGYLKPPSMNRGCMAMDAYYGALGCVNVSSNLVTNGG